jgi:hypothetical protein
VGSPHWPNPGLLAYMEPCATTLLAVHTGTSLVWFAYQRNLFVPQLLLPANLLGYFLVGLRLFGAFTFITGLFDRAGAVLLIVAFLAEYPHFNFMRSVFGLGRFTDHLFVTGAGITGATIGVRLTTGVLTRVVILGMRVAFNLTVPLLPPVELLGHLPIFGVMYLLLLYGSGLPPRAAARLLEPAVRGEIEEARRPGNDGVGAP